MNATIPPPRRRCSACDAGHYGAVRFCPFCGAAQEAPAIEPKPPDPILPMEALPHLDRQDAPPNPAPPIARPAPAAVPDLPSAPRPDAPRPSPRRRTASRRRTFGLRGAVLALLAIAGLSALALARRDVLPAPSRILAGPDWTDVALGPFQGVALLRLTGDGPFSLRLDGERVLRIASGGGASLRLRALRRLELRAGRGSATVTLTPRRG